MSHKLPVKGFKWVQDIFEFDKSFLKSYTEESVEGYSLEVDVQYSGNLHSLYNGLPFLPERMKIEKVEKVVANLHDKADCFIHIRNFTQPLDHGLVF